MICYRDMTFCKAACANESCHRNFTDEVRKMSQKINLPVALADFSEDCDEKQLIDCEWRD